MEAVVQALAILAVALFFGPIIVIICIIGSVKPKGDGGIDLTQMPPVLRALMAILTQMPPVLRASIAIVGMIAWLAVYIPLVSLVFQVPADGPKTTPPTVLATTVAPSVASTSTSPPPTSTSTHTPTSTPAPTNTPTPTATDTPTPTPIPEPASPPDICPSIRFDLSGTHTNSETGATVTDLSAQDTYFELDYDLGAGGWVLATVPMANQDLSCWMEQGASISFSFDGDGLANHLEVKLLDDDGSNFGWVSELGGNLGTRTISLRLKDLGYFFGGDPIMNWHRVAYLEFAVSKHGGGLGGAGHILITDVAVTQ